MFLFNPYRYIKLVNNKENNVTVKLDNTELLKSCLPCIGIDDKIHAFLPWTDKTTCEQQLPIKYKNVGDFGGKLWCYECDEILSNNKGE
jgi:hypothetical protein